MKRISDAQREVLDHLIACPDGFAEPGEIWQHHSSYEYSSSLGQLNFGRTMDALQRRGLVERDDNGWALTDAGRAAVS